MFEVDEMHENAYEPNYSRELVGHYKNGSTEQAILRAWQACHISTQRSAFVIISVALYNTEDIYSRYQHSERFLPKFVKCTALMVIPASS